MKVKRLTSHRAGVVVATAAALTFAGLTTSTTSATLDSDPGGSSSTAGRSAPAKPASDAGVEKVKLDGVGSGTHEVTLITGDVVTLTGKGRRHSVTVTETAPRPGGSTIFFDTESTSDGVYVIPSDAQPAVDAGHLDRELFDVEYLAAHGFADGQSNRLPVIVQYANGRRPTGLHSQARAIPASAATATLPSIDGAALTVPKKHADDFWATLRKPPAGQQRDAVVSADLRRGIEKLWLDRKARVNLDESVPLIGAPQAWEAGYDGTGTTVAVLDTGIDANHPDLDGNVVASRSFVSDTVADGNGHGTHVASTIVGSGAASDGQYRGVASGADLAVGKVCTDTGGCPTSAIVGGMEWAAQAQDADIVSMSLGAGPTDGTDPLSQAVNQLTASTGALFVISAGNSGPGMGTVGAPGTADAALTVAATTKTDGMASFSSRGPRIDGALKPDIAAPGVNIVAARAAGTSLCQDACVPGDGPVDENYTSASGTSMAAPHVSGAAAILAQRHPGWGAAELKAALVSTSHDAGHTVYEQGAGRVDVARAVGQQVYATTPNLDFGRVDIDGDDGPVSKQVGYTNLTDQPVTLSLTPVLDAIEGDPASESALAADATVTVPAGGTATTTVTLDPTALAEATYTGALVATDDATGVQLRTPIGVDASNLVSLTIHMTDLDGDPVDPGRGPADLYAVDVPGVGVVDMTVVGPGTSHARVRPGTYSARMVLASVDPVAGQLVISYLIDPEISVTEDTVVHLDARDTREISIDTPRPAVPYAVALSYQRSSHDGLLTAGTTGNIHFAQSQFRVTPTERVSTGRFMFSTNWVLANPAVTLSASGGGDDMQLDPAIRAHADRGLVFDPNRTQSPVGRDSTGYDIGRSFFWMPFTKDGTFELADAGLGRPEDIDGLDLEGKLALMQYGVDDRGTDDIPDSVPYIDRLNNLRDAGAVGVLMFSNPPTGYRHDFYRTFPEAPWTFDAADVERGVDIPDIELPRDQGKRLLNMLADGPVEVDITSDHNIRYDYQLALAHDQQIGPSHHYRLSSDDLARVDARFHSARTLGAQSLNSSWQPGGADGFTSGFFFAVPQRRVQYVGPLDSGLVRDTSLRYYDSDGQQQRREEAHRVFDTSTHTIERWGTVPFAPGAEVVLNDELGPDSDSYYRECVLCREGDRLYPFTDDITGEHHRSAPRPSLVGLSTADGENIPLENERGFPVFRLPEERQRYQFIVQKENPHTTSRWTFASGTPDEDTSRPGTQCWLATYLGHSPCHPEPAVFLRYDLGEQLRLDNTVATPGAHRFTVHAYNGQSTQPMPRIEGLKLWTSVDGGETWERARVIPKGRDGDDGERSFRVIATYPKLARTSGAVSLKAEAWDVDGNRVKQTITDAFQLTSKRGR